MIDDEEEQTLAATRTQANENTNTALNTTVRFSLPQDILSEQLIFDGTDGDFNNSSIANRRHDGDGSIHSYGAKKRRTGSSQMLRQVTPASLLLYDQNAIADDMKGGARIPESNVRQGGNNIIGRVFLNPSFTLRKQMLLTFGSVVSLTILLVMGVSILSSIVTGNSIKEESKVYVEKWVNESMSNTAQLVAAALSPKIMPDDLVDLMLEIARDRFMGYPTTEDDSLTPFFDTKSQTNMYPFKSNPLPLDWEFKHTLDNKGNVNETNYADHVQDRWSWYSGNPRLSTAIAMYTMQGACDPNAINSSEMGYYPNCTNANNDITTGGVVAPSPTNKQVHRKAADLSPFLKALYEYHHNIKGLGYYFGNSGAGSSIMFPHYELDSSSSYISIGCEWMREPNPTNPELGQIATDEEIARCHPKGAVVRTREYNPLERGWCRDQALDPQRVHNVGPYMDAWNTGSWLMTVGRALYDPVTSAFVCCILLDFTIDSINEVLGDVKVGDLGTLTLVRNDDNGTVVISPNFDFDVADSTATVDDPDLKTGVDLQIFNEIKAVVDFSQQWDPKDALRSFEKQLFDSGEFIISAHPIPSIPVEYDASYTPEFFAIFSLQKTKGIAPIVENVNEEVEEGVTNIILFTVFVGLGGLAVVIFLIFATSYFFVEPLKWMRKVGDQVVGRFGEDIDAGIDFERTKPNLCSPKTELSSLAEEFSKMVTRFSGEGTAKRMKVDDTEKVNLFDFSNDFASLYWSREDSSFPFNYHKDLAKSKPTKSMSPKQRNLGPNTHLSSETKPRSSEFSANNHNAPCKSPLFLWMVGLIVTPLLVITIIISAVFLWRINQLPSLIEPVKNEYLNLKNSYRFSATGMLAIRASAVAEKAVRDAHLLTRFSSWLYFGGIEMSGSFTDVIEGAEECKMALDKKECEWLQTVPCDCAWNDVLVRHNERICTTYPSSSRSLQKVQFAAQSQDADPGTGSRHSINLSKMATSPNMTAWWDNITVLPNLTEGSARSKYGTSYDRVRAVSALSAVFVPLYNYDKSSDKPLGIYIGFAADGMLAGYAGCNDALATGAFWRSTTDNGAAELRPELCPVGKYGYDARCRSWYDEGKKKAEAGNGTLRLTAPYIFASQNIVGQSITLPLLDPQTQRHIGQVLIDFVSDSIFRALEDDNTKLSEGGFPIMVTPESDVLGHDTVVGPGFSLKDRKGAALVELLQADDEFEAILQGMKSGGKSEGTFNGKETMLITYAPVLVRNYHPLNSSDIASGVRNETTLVYSLALVETENEISKPFQSIGEISSKTVDTCVIGLAVLIVMSTLLIVYIAFRVTTSMTEPILELFGVLKDINCMRLSNNDISKLSNHQGSCAEIDSVYKTMEMLYKVVQFANVAFFTGDLNVAYMVLRDALRLFTRLDNKKAVAVSSNNLGNTMLTIYRTMKISNGDEEMYGLSMKEVLEKGVAYFAQSIKLGEIAYDQFYNEQGWSEECLVFMQFLANRYFNRAMFFLTTSSDHENGKEAVSLGFRDLQITADMDVEIVDQCVEMGFKIDRAERYELMMGRIRGLLALVELGYSPDELYIEDQINDAYQDLTNAMKKPSHDLFKEISIVGRMQKLDVELIKYLYHAEHDNVNAARVAIRMLVEDEFLFPDAEQVAITMLLVYMKTSNDEYSPDDDDGLIEKELESVIEALERDHVERSRNLSSLQMSMDRLKSMTSLQQLSFVTNNSQGNPSERSLGGTKDFSKAKSERRSSASRESCRGDVTMEFF